MRMKKAKYAQNQMNLGAIVRDEIMEVSEVLSVLIDETLQ